MVLHSAPPFAVKRCKILLRRNHARLPACSQPACWSFSSQRILLAQSPGVARLKVASPDGQIVFILGDATASQALEPGVNDLRYAVDFHGKWLMDESVLGLKLEGQPALGPGYEASPACKPASTMRPTPFLSARPAACAIITTRRLSILRMIPGESCRLKSVRSTTESRSATSFPINLPSTSVRIEHELTQFRYAKDATLYPLDPRGLSNAV